MSYRLITLDLDGTLLNNQKQILPESLLSLKQARDAGYEVMIATGRHHIAIHPFYQALQLTTPAICCNGAYLYDYPNSKVLVANPIHTQQALEVIKRLQSHQLYGLMYVDDAMLYQQSGEHIQRSHVWSESLPKNQRPVLTHVDSLELAAKNVNAIWKFAVSSEDIAKLHHFADEIERDMGLSCEWSWHDQVDIAQTGNSKGKRLAEYAASRGINNNEIVAFGDNFNDMSMLDTVGLSVAMGNSADEVKAHAKQVIGDNEQPSIAQFIQQHLL